MQACCSAKQCIPKQLDASICLSKNKQAASFTGKTCSRFDADRRACDVNKIRINVKIDYLNLRCKETNSFRNYWE